jgi:alpha-pyrone synthase
MSSYINSIGIANPSFKHEQNDILSFMLSDASAIEHQKKLKAAFRASGVQTRYSVLPDFGSKPLFLEGNPLVDKRMEKYKSEALSLAVLAIKNCLEKQPNIKHEDISHIITVSCTGMYAPGIDIDIINTLSLSPNVARASLNFMGCNAAINALRMGDAIVKAESQAKVLIICVELCTLHYQASSSDDFILSNTLFSDGAAAVLIGSQEKNSLFKIERFHSAIESEGANDMCWNIKANGFEMILTSYVPNLVTQGISKLLNNDAIQLETADHLAIHPGGKKILDTTIKLLNKSEEEISDSYNTLKNYGNMSSPTILFVMHAMLNNPKIKAKEKILAMSFGPGLSIETMELVVVDRDRPLK